MGAGSPEFSTGARYVGCTEGSSVVGGVMLFEYWEAMKKVESSTPNDSLDTYVSMGKYKNKGHAQKMVDIANKKLFADLRKNPGYPLTATYYFVQLRSLNLIEVEPLEVNF